MHEHTIRELAHLTAVTGSAPSDDTVAADVARGRRAASTRRRVLVTAGSVTAAAAGVIAFTVGATSPIQHTAATAGQSTIAISQDSGLEADSAQQRGTLAVRLVSYSGQQPAGYHLAKIPAGFTVETSDQHNLILAPNGLDLPAPPSGMVDYTGRIVISQQESFAYDLAQRTVTINGHPALIALSNGANPATEVRFTTGDHTVTIQIAYPITLTDQQIVEFAENVTVTGNPTTFSG